MPTKRFNLNNLAMIALCVLERPPRASGLPLLQQSLPVKLSAPERGRYTCFVAIVIGFVISRVFYAKWEDPFYLGEWMWQIVDFDLLTKHLAQSIFYLHSQPPLLNLLLGVVLKLTPGLSHARLVLENIYRLMGLSIVLIAFRLMLDLAVPQSIALFLSLLFEFNPGMLMLENCFYTSCPTQLLFCASAFCLNRFLTHRRKLYRDSFLACAALPIFFNTSFQPIWFLAIVAFCWYALRQRVRAMLPAIVVIFGLITILLIKNAMVFGVFTTSSWFGMNLARVTMPQVSWEAQHKEILEGKLSGFALIQPFESLDKYPTEKAEPTDIAVLDSEKKANGTCNYNNILYVDISRQYLHDALWSLVHHPLAYLHEMVRTCGCYFGTYKDQDAPVSSRLGAWNRLYDSILLPSAMSWWPRQQRCDTVSLTLLMGLPMIFVLTSLPLAGVGEWNTSDLTKAFMLMTIAFTTATAVMFEIGENPRFRSVVDPLFLILLGCLLGDLVQRFRSTSQSAFSHARAEQTVNK